MARVALIFLFAIICLLHLSAGARIPRDTETENKPLDPFNAESVNKFLGTTFSKDNMDKFKNDFMTLSSAFVDKAKQLANEANAEFQKLKPKEELKVE